MGYEENTCKVRQEKVHKIFYKVLLRANDIQLKIQELEFIAKKIKNRNSKFWIKIYARLKLRTKTAKKMTKAEQILQNRGCGCKNALYDRRMRI